MSHFWFRSSARLLRGRAHLCGIFVLLACSAESGTHPHDNEGGTGNGAGGSQPGKGGSPNQNGGTPNNQGGSTSGGSPNTSGGSTSGGSNSGGSNSGGNNSAGGNSNSGGAINMGSGGSTGGKSASGGTNAGGTQAKGGTTGMGGTTAKGGTSNSGGTTGMGGNVAKGGTGSGGTSSGMGGTATGSGGTTGSGGSSTGSGVFSQCRFHFGTIDSKAKSGGSALISQLDFFTPGWMMNEAFDQQYVCDEGKAGGALQNQVPVIVTYIAANYVKKHYNLCDCNVTSCGANNDLCHHGAQYISQNLTTIVNAYKSYSQGYANCYGTTRPIVFEMEPDFYQYTGSSQSQPWSASQAGQIMSQLVAALKTSLPNARFSIDASPWVGSNGSDNGAAWFSNFNMSLFTFVNTSGGGTNANTAKIRSANNMTWAGLSQVTGKPILADTGYGANGVSAGHDANWDVVSNINARIADGVISISQYNPNSNWGSTISSIRGQLSTPKFCP
ncbi:MAG: hypothetical protein ACOY0T_13330 [Myxococcota bacterium]